MHHSRSAISDGYNGYLTTLDDVVSLKNQVKNYYFNENKQEIISSFSRYTSRMFNSLEFNSKLEKLYNEIIG